MKLALLDSGAVDLAFGAGGIAHETGLESAVIVSLLTDRRADADDSLPDDNGSRAALVPPDRRGWAGDALAEDPADRIGSRLWLLAREKQTEATRRRAISYAREALEWLIEDGHALSVEIEAQWSAPGRLEMVIAIETVFGSLTRISLPLYGGIHAV